MHRKLVPIYVCDYCNKEFDSDYLCELHEKDKHICPNCVHSYYVYGCEFNCELKNNNKKCKFESKDDALQKEIKQKKQELNLLIKQSKKYSPFSYENCEKIADRLNSFYYCKDREKKKRLFFKYIIYLAQKSKNHIYTYEEMMEKLNNVEYVLNRYKGTTLDKDAREEFMSKYFPIIDKHGIDGIIYMNNDIDFKPYSGKINYFSKLYEEI